MHSHKELWEYAISILELPRIPLEQVSAILGTSNIDAMIASATERIANAKQRLDERDAAFNRFREQASYSSLHAEEIRLSGSRDERVLHNMGELLQLLEVLRSRATEAKFVLPQFRGVSHFETGDELMIYIGKTSNDVRSVPYDWISAKMLCPDGDGGAHCHSNMPWTHDGSNGGHYFCTANPLHIFKREEFYGLRYALEHDELKELTSLLSVRMKKSILEGSLEPLTSEELAVNQELYIRRAKDVVSFYSRFVPIMAKRYGVQL